MVQDKLLNKLRDKHIVIWGARMTGIGFLKFARKHRLDVLGFIDSDPSLYHKEVQGVMVFNPEMYISKGATVVITASMKEDLIIKQLEDKGITNYIKYSDYCKDIYTIDISGTCNLKCPSCVHCEDRGVPKGFMSFDTYKEVLHEIIEVEAEMVTHINLYSWGEPFLNPWLADIIKYTRAYGIAVALSSNLSIESNYNFNQALKANPDYLKVSVSGYYPEVYNTTHTGGDINLVKSNLYKLRYLIDRNKLDTFVEVNYHLYNNNLYDYYQMKELCKELNFTMSKTNAIMFPVERIIEYHKGKRIPITDLLLKLPKKKEFIGECPFSKNQVTINWDLTRPKCCVTYYREDVSCEECKKLGIPRYLMGG